MKKTLIIIPSRMQSSRLPGKPLLDMEGIPMVIRVALKAKESKVGDVLIACCDDSVSKAANSYGINVVHTRSDHISGSDRIYEALTKIDPQKNIETIINLQGDMPTISSKAIFNLVNYKHSINSDIFTLANEIKDEEEIMDSNVVKVVISRNNNDEYGKALYFSRSPIPYGNGPLYHHIGIYAYSRESLEKFIKLKASELELRESLEQLRALEANMDIKVGIVDEFPIGVDNLADFKKACDYVRNNKN
ncbi:MAG: 3-deoxy-manno-octulosonate cytidylyltransferase [Alphaproteobacteria bacterium]|jgi:3-deoxy-manno-octulosonate cytidylyltransferase (CMP-KDO synthetase)|nr:3-deoxy-manno-octulosonate cytidylyltransferase [Alphaproteobacteria bacterium]